jgi:hypothetical protein
VARTIEQIQQQIIDRIKATPVLAAVLTSTSAVAIWYLWTYVIATVIWTLEVEQDLHKAEVTEIIDKKDPHHTRWYAEIAKKFQYGYQLPADDVKYDNSGLTDEQISNSMIISYCAVVEQDKGLRIKVARLVNGDLAPLDANQLSAFKEYMARVKDAGVRLQIDSLPADSLKLKLRIYYDPLVISANGSRLDGSDNRPVPNAVNKYLKNLPFNGTLALALLVDSLQDVQGVVIPHVVEAQARYGTINYTSFDVQYSPDAGYLRIINDTDQDIDPDTDLKIEYIAQTVIT